jgi:hypothetical protein
MKFRKAKWNDVEMSGLQGYITTDYKTLVKKLGKPHTSGDKTTAEWQIVFENGVVATIYDWKYGQTPKGICQWNIGGHHKDAVKLVSELVRS